MTVIEIKKPQDLVRLRRLALNAQGLLQTQPFGTGLAGARKAINHISYVQIDTISVVERAHHHILHSRVPKFKPEMINKMLIERDVFEYWTHAAAYIPIADFRFSLPYKHAIKSGKKNWYKTPDKKLMTELLARIRADGPIRSRDIKTMATKQSAWWNLKPAKKALEQLYMQGDLMISNREGFQKTYDLTERVLPSQINSQMPSIEEFSAHIVEQQLRCHGVVSLKGLTYLRRNLELRKSVKSLVDERLSQGSLEQIQLNSGEHFLVKTGTLERAPPSVKNRMSIISPFDNSVIQRERLKSLFHFDYQIECYVPAAKRQYGYFSLPLLFGDQFIGRMDCKAHRKERHLEIKSLDLQEHIHDQDLIISAFIEAMTAFCHFQQCDTVSLTTVEPKHLKQALNSLLSQLIPY